MEESIPGINVIINSTWNQFSFVSRSTAIKALDVNPTSRHLAAVEKCDWVKTTMCGLGA
jgi:hypothetical protein